MNGSSPSPEEALTLLLRHASLHAHPDSGGDTSTMVRINAAAAVLRQQKVETTVCMRFHCVTHAPSADHEFMSGRWKGKLLSEVPLTTLAWHADPDNQSSLQELAYDWLHWRITKVGPW